MNDCIFNCSKCISLRFDSCLNGYCDCKSSPHYREVVVNDKSSGTICEQYRGKKNGR